MNGLAARRIAFRSESQGRGPAARLAQRGREKRRLLLGLAAITMAAEVAGLLFLPDVEVGSIPVSVSIIPALMMALALGPARRSTVEYEKVLPFWFAIGAGVVMGTVLFARSGNLVDVVPLLAAAADEEIVYRLAVPIVITVALSMLRVPARTARFSGYLLAGAWWVALPGHQAQMTSVAVFGSYVAFAVLAALVVSRSRALIAMSGAHAVMNMVTISQFRGEINATTRGVLVGLLLLLLVGTFARPGLRRRPAPTTSSPAPGDGVDTVIDLRDDAVPTGMQDGEVTSAGPGPLDLDEPAPSGPR